MRRTKVRLIFMAQRRGFAPLAARPGEQHTVLFSLRQTSSAFQLFARKPIAPAIASYPQIPVCIRFSYKNETDKSPSHFYGAETGI